MTDEKGNHPETRPSPSFTLFVADATTVSSFEQHFIDDHGRILDLRGANVGAGSKVPNEPRGLLHDHPSVSYTNRPFPLSEAEEHWTRLKSWGFNLVRINVTWDAVEHEGKGIYDTEYLAYLRALLQSLKGHGIVAFIAIHQDVWSRYCGGSGAPGWTLEAAGFDLSNDGEKLALSGTAFLDGIRGGRLEGERGLWPTGYQKLVCATMNTLFWAGKTFAPSFTIPSDTKGSTVNIQDYLQDGFFGMVDQLLHAVGDLDTVIGMELLNEPHPGFIGLPTIHEWNYNTDLHLGQFPSPLQSFSMGSGRPTPGVPIYKRTFPFPTKISKYITANPTGACVWRKDTGNEDEKEDGVDSRCIWEREGVWKWSTKKDRPVALQEDYFTKDRSGRKVNWYDDCYFPFVKRWEESVAKSPLGKGKYGKGKEKMRMVEALPNEYCPTWPEDQRPKNMVYAPHWYDLNALFKKEMGFMTVNVQGLSRGMFLLNALYFGEGVKKNYAVQIRNIVKEARAKLGPIPIIIGECGIPMDLNKEEAFRTGDWKWQERMMDAMISALEASQVAFTLWNYNPLNTDSHGDDWNAENFSWYSSENRRKELAAGVSGEVAEMDAGARLLDAIVRPYVVAMPGRVIRKQYNTTTGRLTLGFQSPYSPTSDTPLPAHVTEIFLPKRMFKTEADVAYTLSPEEGRISIDTENQRAYVWFEDGDPDDHEKKPEAYRHVEIWVKGRKQEPGFMSYFWLMVAIAGFLHGVRTRQFWIIIAAIILYRSR